jgi:cytochrome P450
MTIVSDPAIDALLLEVLITPEGRADPYRAYAQMHESAPIHRTSFGPLLVTGYAESMGVLRDPRLGRGLGGDQGPLNMFGGGGGGVGGDGDGTRRRGEFFDRVQHNMLLADPPDHTRLRQLVSRTFTPRQVDRLRPAVHTLVDKLLDDMAEAVDVEFLTQFALPLPMSVIGELVGVPEDDRAALQPKVRAVAKGIEPVLTDDEAAESMAAIEFLGEYFADLLDQRRRQPTDDLMSGLAQAREKDDCLTDEEVCSTAILLFAAGFETTTNLLGNGLLALLRHPEQLALWRRTPELASSATEELLRWDSPVQLNIRAALEESELAGATVAAGERIIVLQGAANRDPLRFSDPNTLDLARADNAPLSFGWGIHHCIGAGLARMEGEIAFSSLLERFPTIELRDEAPQWRPTFTLRGLLNLPIAVSTR